ncbi:MAG: hypothetical protein EBQ76_02250 [Betaproteobacteria bacterium]|nr:hypothetical protein [Betaproteobacteria bacterium]
MGIVNRPRYQSPPAGCRDWAGLAHGVVYEGWIRSASEGQITALLIHGTASDRWTWEPLIEALPLGIGLLAIDLPGHGLTALPRGDGAHSTPADFSSTLLLETALPCWVS